MFFCMFRMVVGLFIGVCVGSFVVAISALCVCNECQLDVSRVVYDRLLGPMRCAMRAGLRTVGAMTFASATGSGRLPDDVCAAAGAGIRSHGPSWPLAIQSERRSHPSCLLH